MPYAHRAAGPANRDERAMMLDGMRAVNTMFARAHPQLLAYGSIPIGPAASLGEEPYRASGTALDYMYEKARVRRSFLLEVFGASTVYGLGGRSERAVGMDHQGTEPWHPPRDTWHLHATRATLHATRGTLHETRWPRP